MIHEHHARNLHFDLRLEMGGVLKSWAVPKGVSMNPADRRLAVLVPDHSLSYIGFEGTLPEGTYGAGKVRIWDNGKYDAADDPEAQFQLGKIEVEFHGSRIRGRFTLVRMARQPKNWLLIKSHDQFADANWQLTTVLEPKKRS